MIHTLIRLTALFACCSLSAAVDCEKQASGIFFERLTHEEILEDHSLRALHSVDPGHPKCILEFEGFPIDRDITVTIRRPVGINGKVYKSEQTFRILPDESVLTNRNVKLPYYFISARGYLPGERITLQFDTEDEHLDHEVILIPNAMIAQDRLKVITVEAELRSLDPVEYELHVAGIAEGEKFWMRTKSFNEIADHTIKFSPFDNIVMSPSIPDKEGGQAEVAICTKENALARMHLPWGDKLSVYLLGDTIYKP